MSAAADPAAGQSDAADQVWKHLTRMITEASEAGLTPSSVNPDHRLIEDLGISSIMAVNLVIDLEDAFDIRVKQEDFAAIATAGDVHQLILKRKAAA